MNTWIANPGDLRGPEGPAGNSDLANRFTNGNATGSTGGSGSCLDGKVIGEVWQFAGNFAPRGSASAEGQLLAISSNTALFSILGTIYGGDGRTTFGLPDLRGLAPEGVTYVICLGGAFPSRN